MLLATESLSRRLSRDTRNNPSLFLSVVFNFFCLLKSNFVRNRSRLILFLSVWFAGIMTLTSSPCELDNMSLFQDLKLKRRKVDSRCSSDGKKSFFPFLFSRSTTHLPFRPPPSSPSSSRTTHRAQEKIFIPHRDVSWKRPSVSLSTRALINNTPLSFFFKRLTSKDHGLISYLIAHSVG